MPIENILVNIDCPLVDIVFIVNLLLEILILPPLFLAKYSYLRNRLIINIPQLKLSVPVCSDVTQVCLFILKLTFRLALLTEKRNICE